MHDTILKPKMNWFSNLLHILENDLVLEYEVNGVRPLQQLYL